MLYIGRRAAVALLADSFAGSCGLRSACGQRQHVPPTRCIAEPTQLFIELATAHSSANSALFLQFVGRVGGMNRKASLRRRLAGGMRKRGKAGKCLDHVDATKRPFKLARDRCSGKPAYLQI